MAAAARAVRPRSGRNTSFWPTPSGPSTPMAATRWPKAWTTATRCCRGTRCCAATTTTCRCPASEPRGLLHCVLTLPDGLPALHVMCVHLGLRESHRRHQLARLCETVQQEVPADAPLVVAGDFNDWRGSCRRAARTRRTARSVHAGARASRAQLPRALAAAAAGPHLRARRGGCAGRCPCRDGPGRSCPTTRRWRPRSRCGRFA